MKIPNLLNENIFKQILKAKQERIDKHSKRDKIVLATLRILRSHLRCY